MAWVVTYALWPDDLGLTGPFGANNADESGPEDAKAEELAAAWISPHRFRIVNDEGEIAIEGRSDQPVYLEGLWFQFDRCEAFYHHYNLLQELCDGKWITLNNLRRSGRAARRAPGEARITIIAARVSWSSWYAGRL
jgi:hypothetical protein